MSEKIGYTNNINNARYERKYESSSIKDLKKTLKKLKLKIGDVPEIKFVAIKVPKLLNTSNNFSEANNDNKECRESDHDYLISKNF